MLGDVQCWWCGCVEGWRGYGVCVWGQGVCGALSMLWMHCSPSSTSVPYCREVNIPFGAAGVCLASQPASGVPEFEATLLYSYNLLRYSPHDTL